MIILIAYYTMILFYDTKFHQLEQFQLKVGARTNIEDEYAMLY